MSTLETPIKQKMSNFQWLIGYVLPIVIFSIFLLSQGVNPITTFSSMLASVFTDFYGFGEVIIATTPFILTAIATAIPARAGLVNVGGEGQLMIGALTTTIAAVYVFDGFPMWIGIPLLIICGALGGLVWSGIAAVLKVKGGMNETITTLLLNYIAFYTVSAFVHGPLKDPTAFNWPFSPEFSDSLRLPTIPGSRIHIGIVLAIIIAIVVYFLFKKTRWGFFMKIVGGNPIAALQSGIKVNKMQFWALLIGGAIAGIAGMIEVAGMEGRLRPTTGVDIGYIGFLAAWMARNHMIGLIFTSFVIGVISVSGNSMEMNAGLPSSTVHILMALVLFGILAMKRGDKS
ncbi:ABC transporter permease [Gracilibacillus sp. HCP3S3_G5_1]|uniref:ABC transporter permease n=1 Tax=unclassified Gracilibacillus TaxID=2625209 RepID=UPI003F8AB554